MMRAILFLSLVGAALYGFLVLTEDAKRGVAVANADPWNGRWSRRAERRRGIGLFVFRPIANGR